MTDLDRATTLVAAARRVTVLTGAGISTDTGIPDFRGPNGVWTKNPAAEKASTLAHYLADPGGASRRRGRPGWRRHLRRRAQRRAPALVDLERQGKLVAIVTQNVDGLHQRAGSDPDRVIEVHGTMHWTICWRCGDRGRWPRRSSGCAPARTIRRARCAAGS